MLGATRQLLSKRSGLKTEIFKTNDGKIIVEDELLNFLAVKIKTLSQDEIVLLATKTFDLEAIEASKKVWFELCPGTTQRCVAHKGQHRDSNNIGDGTGLAVEQGAADLLVDLHLMDDALACCPESEPRSCNGSGVAGAAMGTDPAGSVSATASPSWNKVVKNGWRGRRHGRSLGWAYCYCKT